VFFFPESPRFNYSKEKFEDARDGLYATAKFNSNDSFSRRFLFDTEKEIDDLKS